MSTLAHFLTHHPLLFIACVWIGGGLAFAWFESRAGMEDV